MVNYTFLNDYFMMMPHNPDTFFAKRAKEIAVQLLQIPSITPNDLGCMTIVQEILEPLGFVCHIQKVNAVDNFYARKGQEGPHLCFLGHTDVVPILDRNLWDYDPFQGTIDDNGFLVGRGAVDMKGAIACFLAAIEIYCMDYPEMSGSISALLTSDEEGDAIDGIAQMVPWLKDQHVHIDLCICTEPTNPDYIGQMMKIGRRGSLSCHLVVQGKSGHVAYPEQAINPIPVLLSVLNVLQNRVWDEGWPKGASDKCLFTPTHLEIIRLMAPNPVSNMIIDKAEASLNIRFNPTYTRKQLEDQIVECVHQVTKDMSNMIIDVSFSGNADPFILPDTKNNHRYQDLLSHVIQEITGHIPMISTSGGTSDARFMHTLCPVIEFGLINQSAHQVNEKVSVDDLVLLTKIYYRMMQEFFRSV